MDSCQSLLNTRSKKLETHSSPGQPPRPTLTLLSCLATFRLHRFLDRHTQNTSHPKDYPSSFSLHCVFLLWYCLSEERPCYIINICALKQGTELEITWVWSLYVLPVDVAILGQTYHLNILTIIAKAAVLVINGNVISFLSDFWRRPLERKAHTC